MRQATDQALPLVMVTGASSGIGKALAMAFAREGHPLLLISRHIEPIAGLPEDTVYRQADVADYGAITAAVDGRRRTRARRLPRQQCLDGRCPRLRRGG